MVGCVGDEVWEQSIQTQCEVDLLVSLSTVNAEK